jgi:hypothetical protein
LGASSVTSGLLGTSDSRGIVHGRHVDRHGRGVAGVGAVRHRIGEVRRFVEVGVGREGDAAVQVENRRTAGPARYRADRQLRIGVDESVSLPSSCAAV